LATFEHHFICFLTKNYEQAYITFEQHFIRSREEIWSRRSEISTSCWASVLRGIRTRRPWSERDLDGDLVVAVLHLLLRAFTVAAGDIDLGEEVADDAVGAFEDAVGDGGEAGGVFLGCQEQDGGGGGGGLGADPLEARGEHGRGGGCLGLEHGERMGGGGDLDLRHSE
jgi:hypothetical protein